MKAKITTTILSLMLLLVVAACQTSETQINWDDPIANSATLTYADARDMIIEAGSYELANDIGVADTWLERCMSSLSDSYPERDVRCRAALASVLHHLFRDEIKSDSVGTVECPEEKIDVKAMGEIKDEQVGASNSDLTVGDAIRLANEAGEFNSLEGNPMTLEWRDGYEQLRTTWTKWMNMCLAAYPPDSVSGPLCSTIWERAYWHEFPEQYDKYRALYCVDAKG